VISFMHGPHAGTCITTIQVMEELAKLQFLSSPRGYPPYQSAIVKDSVEEICARQVKGGRYVVLFPGFGR